ncbi:MAG TPA: hypothetical protein VMW77_04275, partial [Methanoregula sp.]|nr:hypothetical protein [Methanoregula sp.]
RLDQAVSFRLAEINQRTGTLAAQQERYTEEQEKILADQKTIRDAGADGTCPLCRQKLGSHFGSLDAEFAQKLQELADTAAAGRKKQENLKKEKTVIGSLQPSLDSIHSLTEKLRQKPGHEAELAELEAKHTKKTQEQQAMSASLTRLAYDDEAYKACERETAEVQKVQLRFIELGKKTGQGITAKKQLAELTARIAERNAGLTKLAGEITASAIDPAIIAKMEADMAENDSAIRNEEVVIAGATRDLHFTKEKIDEYKRGEVQIALLQKQAASLKEEIELLKLTRKVIADYVIYLMQVVRSRIEGEVSRIISEITGGRYEQVLLDEDFNLLIRDIDNDYSIDRFSGGEQDDIAVALRIALSRYLAELHNVHESTILIFDEIFGSQDEERRNSLLTTLRTQESRFPQIILISHIPEMQGEFANTLVVEIGTDMVSRVKEVGD